VQIATTTTTTYVDSGLSASTTFSYTVSAYDAASNESAPSSALSVTTSAALDTEAPSVPMGLASSSLTSSGVTIDWSDSSDNVGVTGYRVFRDGVQIATTTTTTYVDSGLSASTTYSYTVSAYDAASNESAPSSALSVTTPPTGGGSIISEDFSTSAANFTEISGGTWAVSTGRYVLSNPVYASGLGLLGNISVHDTQVPSDFVLTARMNVTSNNNSNYDHTSIVFGYQDANNYYYVNFGQTNSIYSSGIFGVVNGSYTELADITTTVVPGTDHDVSIERSGSTITVYLDQTQVASTTDSTFTTGLVGFGSFHDGGQFDDLVVTTP